MGDLAKRLDVRLSAVVFAWVLLLATNDALPYVGLRDDSCQTMFCGLEWGEHWNTHLFVPQHAISDLWAYLEITHVVISPAPVAERDRSIARWLTREGRDRNTEAVRVAVAQLCASGHRIALDVRRTDDVNASDARRSDVALTHHDDACSAPSLAQPHRFLPVRVYETDIPSR